MTADDDAVLARLLVGHLADLLTWLDDYPADQVDRSAVASIRESITWVINQAPAEQRAGLASGNPDGTALRTAAGLLVDVMWWLETRPDDEVDEWAAGKIQESTAASVAALSDRQRRRLLEILADLAAAERHDVRRYELRFFPFACGLLDTEPDERAPLVRGWVKPEDRR